YVATDGSGYNGTPTATAFVAKRGPSPSGVAWRGVQFAPVGGDLALPAGSGRLSVGPVIDVFASALRTCPDTTETDVYSLANPGTSSIGWTASVNTNWVTLSASSGTPTAMVSINVTVTLISGVHSLPPLTNSP